VRPRTVSAWAATIVPAFLILWVPAGTAQSVDRRLSIQQAIATALEHHPSVRGADAGLRAAGAGLTQSRSGFFPSLSFSGTGVHTEGAFVFNPSFPPREQIYNSYTAALQVQQTLWDFGKTSNKVGASSDLVDASAADYASTLDNVSVNVQIAYFTLMQSLQVESVDVDAVHQAEKHLTQAKAFYTVGRRPQFDVTKAELDLANASVALIRARNQSLVARLQLENAMGIRLPEGTRVADTFDVTPLDVPLDSLRGFAMERRPDLLAARARVAANDELADAAWSLHLPTVSASGAYTWTNFQFPLYNRWNAGVSISFPLFQGFSIVAGEQIARATADVSRAALESVNESAMLDVEQTFLALGEAKERIAATDKLVEQAEQNSLLAERQYAAGIATAIEVTDAQLSLANARITRIQALFDYSSARVRLLRSSGILRR
jgi:outer membrane protein